jgi:hypothetical protein
LGSYLKHDLGEVMDGEEKKSVERPEQFQDFIFRRELAEVYLLLDHVSGSSSKSLPAAFDEKDETVGASMIAQICDIGWPTAAIPPELGQKAATLLIAKDRLNHAARPANGASIAFTLLVSGDDEDVAKRQARRRALLRWPHMRSPTDAAPLPVDPSDGPNRWQGPVPSRTSLARHAYPGLVATASRFNRRVKTLTYLLLGWLILTCMLSWNVAAGHAIVARLDAANVAVADPKKVGTDTAELTSRLESARQNLQNWQDTWDWAQGTHWICGSLCAKHSDGQSSLAEETRAAAFVEILATAILPICYGLLGAGAAVVRGIYAKMSTSQLSPRDYPLAVGQLALGAVIGACIGLFVSPSSGGAQGTSLLSAPGPLSLSALSFIAGFGVESVFVALDSFIKRIFNISSAEPAAALSK